MRKLFVFFIFAIIYGSLFPFTFNFNDGVSQRWDILFNSFYPFTSIGDVLGNTVLFIPFGFLGIDALASKTRKRIPLLNVIIFGVILATLIQFIQVYTPNRDPAISDVYWNSAGILLGMFFAQTFEKYFPKIHNDKEMKIPAILAITWLMYVFFPFVPSLDFQEVKNTLKPLFLNPEFEWETYLIGTTGWLLFAYHSKGILQNVTLDRLRLPLFALLSLPARLIIISNSIDLSDVLSVITALILWPILSKGKMSVERTFVAFLVISYSIYSIGSLDFSSANTNFSWIPFSGFLEGNMFTNSSSLLFKIFIYGNLVWLAKKSWPGYKFMPFLVFLYILTIEVFHSFMASHTGEITDPLLVLILASILREKKKRFQLHNEHETDDLSDSTDNIQESVMANTIGKEQIKKGPISKNIQLLASIAIITLLVSIIINLPGIPYNVSELFRLDGLFISIIPFAVFIIWFGMSIPLICRYLIKNPSSHWIRFPKYVIGSGIISYFLLKLSVTDEALADITGSSNILWFVVNQNIWGGFGQLLSTILPFDFLWKYIENIVRFVALFSPVTLMLCIFYYPSALIKKYEIRDTISKLKLIGISFLIYSMYAVPLFILCKVIAFDFSSTDNLNELIAREGFMGTGGGGYLYMLILLLCLNSVWVTQTSLSLLPKAASVLIAGALGWFLLNLGLEDEIQKYGETFSGIDFLLGPDRETKLSEAMLFTRWIILYASSIAVLSWGMSFNILKLLNIKNKQKKERI